MLFTDVSSARAVKAFRQAGFWISKSHGTKHIGMNNGQRKITILKTIIRDAGLTDEEFKRLC